MTEKRGITEKILGVFGIHKCHYCGKYVLPWQEFCGKINMPVIADGKPHPILAKWVTHNGECTQKDIQKENQVKTALKELRGTEETIND